MAVSDRFAQPSYLIRKKVLKLFGSDDWTEAGRDDRPDGLLT